MNPPARHHLRRGRTHTLIALLGATLALAPAAAATAAPTRPIVQTGAAFGITYQSANLGGTITAGGSPTTYFFQYGRSTKYGSQSLPNNIPATGHGAALGPIAGLVPLTTYHFRLVAVNAVGTALGVDRTFKTAAIPLSLAIVAVPNPSVTGAPVSVSGTLAGTGAAGRPVVLQQNPFPYTAGFQNVGNPQLTSPTGGFQFTLLPLGQTTQFRVASAGPGQQVVSSVLTDYVALSVSMRVTVRRARRGAYNVRFAGTITPAQDGARVSIQRLVGHVWKLVKQTNPHSSTASNSSYGVTVRRHHGGFYRAFVTPVEGGHVANFSLPLLVHLAGRID